MPSREFSVRVDSGMARWVRARGSPSDVARALALGARRGLLRADAIDDPGPGPERLTVRLAPREVAVVRTATHSREGLVALRRLFAAGVAHGALPAGPHRRALEAPHTHPPASICSNLIPAQPRATAGLQQPPPAVVRPTVEGWPDWKLAAYRTAHNANLPWAQRQAALRKIESGRQPADTQAAAVALEPNLGSQIFWVLALPVIVLGLAWLLSRKGPAVLGNSVAAALPKFSPWHPAARTALAGIAFGV